MEELSIEEKAKAYDEALERAKKLKETCDSTAVVGWCEYIFPEIQESEDEKIRKEIINFLELPHPQFVGKRDHEKWLAWLEKQGEQKPIEWDADDDEKFFFLKARLKDYEDCIIYDEELSECQKNNVRETTKEFLKWLDSIKERIGG